MSANGLLGRKNVAVFDEAEAALAAFKRSQPDLYGWVAAGAPNLTEAKHVALFGELYKATRSQKSSGAPRGPAT